MARKCYVTAVNTVSWKEDAEEADMAMEDKARSEVAEEIKEKEIIGKGGRLEKVQVS